MVLPVSCISVKSIITEATHSIFHSSFSSPINPSAKATGSTLKMYPKCDNPTMLSKPHCLSPELTPLNVLPLPVYALCCDMSSLQAWRAHGSGWVQMVWRQRFLAPSFLHSPSFSWFAEESSWGRATGQGSPTTSYHNCLPLTERHPSHPSCTVLMRAKESPGKERSPFYNQGTINWAELTGFPCMHIRLWKGTQDPWPKSNVLSAGTCRRDGGRHL